MSYAACRSPIACSEVLTGAGRPHGMQVGVHLSKELMVIAGRSLKANITTLAPLVLPLSEQAQFLANLVGRKVCRAHMRS